MLVCPSVPTLACVRCVGCDVRCLVVVILQMDGRVSALNDTLEELRREGKKASTPV